MGLNRTEDKENQEPQLWQDKLDLNRVFPENVWVMVCGLIDNPKDYYALCKASPQYKLWLEPLKIRIFFPALIHVLANKIGREVESGTVCDLDAEPDAEPDAEDTSKFQSIAQMFYSFRTVSRSWKDTVDSRMERVMLKLEDLADVPDKLPSYSFSDIHDLTRFESHFNTGQLTNQLNPFIWRFLDVEYMSSPEHGFFEFWEKLLEILKIYGDQLWYVRVSGTVIREENVSMIDYYRKLVQLLRVLPNLKTLDLSSLVLVPENDRIVPDANEEIVISAELESELFPTLKQFDTYKSCSSNCFLKYFLEKNVDTFKIITTYEETINANDIYVGPLSHVNYLNLWFHAVDQFLAFENTNFVWRCDTVEINLAELRMDLNRVIRVLNARFRKDLERLELYAPTLTTHAITETLNFPEAQTLHLYLRSFVSIDFILPVANSLVSLIITVDSTSSINQQNLLAMENVLKFFQFRENLKQSNIWSLFPKLRSIYYTDPCVSGAHTRKSLVNNVVE